MAKFAVKTLEFDKVKTMLSDMAATFLGKQKATALQIDNNFASVKLMHEETASAYRLLEEGKAFPFGGAYNIEEDVKRAQLGSVLDAEALLRVMTTAEAFGAMKLFLQNNEEIAPALMRYSENLQLFTRLEKQIAAAVDEHGNIKDSASPKLNGLRTAIVIAKNRVKDKLDAILHDPNTQKFFQDNLVTMRGDRYVIPVKQEYRTNFPGIVHDQSGTGATLFIEPMAVVNLNNDIKRYLVEERNEVERIMRQLSQNIGSEAQALLQCLDVFSSVDLVHAKARLALAQRAIRPRLLLEGGVNIFQGRHPLLNSDDVIPLDIELGNDFSMLLITGPNTGGKTVALKTVGIFALMAQAGMFIPAAEAALPVFRAIFADIGDEQSIEQSLSTFSAHMKNIIGILEEAESGDLVLVDEICAGTDPNEGAALAMSILEYLYENKVLTMATTHYSELKTFAYGHTGMQNASVEFDDVSLRPTYRLLMGIPGSSNAFSISRRLGLSEAIVEKAGLLLDQEHVHMESVLQELDGERRRYEESNRASEAFRRESEQLRNQLASAKQDFERKKNEMLRKAREQADEIYRRSRRESELVLKELRKFKADFDTKRLEQIAKEAREKLNKSFVDDEALPEGNTLVARSAEKGMTVYVPSLGKNGIISAVKGDDITVQCGVLKLTLPANKCILPKETVAFSKEEKNSKQRKITKAGFGHQLFVSKNSTAKQEVDLRGMTVDEAALTVDKAIDDALLAGISQLRLIHGKGTGALRAGLTAYLEQHRLVHTVSSASALEGGSGVTIIDI